MTTALSPRKDFRNLVITFAGSACIGAGVSVAEGDSFNTTGSINSDFLSAPPSYILDFLLS